MMREFRVRAWILFPVMNRREHYKRGHCQIEGNEMNILRMARLLACSFFRMQMSP